MEKMRIDMDFSTIPEPRLPVPPLRTETFSGGGRSSCAGIPKNPRKKRNAGIEKRGGWV